MQPVHQQHALDTEGPVLRLSGVFTIQHYSAAPTSILRLHGVRKLVLVVSGQFAKVPSTWSERAIALHLSEQSE